MIGRLAAAALAFCLAGTAFAQAPAQPDRAAIEQIVRDYLLRHPEVLVEAMQELRRRQETAAAEVAKQAMATRKAEIFSDPDSPSSGDANGDVTIVEFFDYHCGYCKQVHEPMLTLLKDDRKLRMVYKELPILAPESRVAAAAALAAGRQGKYVEMHGALMTARGKLDKVRVLALAKELKLDPIRLEKDMETPEIQGAIDRNLRLASALGIEGTPAFIIGDQIAPGALSLDQLKELVAEARKK